MSNQYRCPNCEYVGAAKLKKSSSSMLITGLLFLASFFIPWLLILAIPALIWLLVEKREASCTKCGWKHVVPAG